MKYIHLIFIGIFGAIVFAPFSHTYSQTFNFPPGQPVFDAPPADETELPQPVIQQTANTIDPTAGLILPKSRIDENTGLPAGIEEQISLTTNPQYPKPGDTVSFSLESFSSDLQKARMTWYQNGTIIADGRGITKQTLTLSPDGKETSFRVVIEKNNGGTIEKLFTIEPAGIDLLYEALTYTPPFYKGRKIFSHQSAVKVIAVPQFNSGNRTYDASELVYKWEKNGSVVQEYSGLGQDVLILEADLIPRPVTITVTVTAPQSNLRAREIMTLNIHETDVHLYENNPIFGVIYSQSLNNGRYILDRNEIEVIAEPYFFSSENAQDIQYAWKMNGLDIPASDNDRELIFRNSENVTGGALISTTVRHAEKLLQQGRSSLTMEITQPNETSNPDSFNF